MGTIYFIDCKSGCGFATDRRAYKVVHRIQTCRRIVLRQSAIAALQTRARQTRSVSSIRAATAIPSAPHSRSQIHPTVTVAGHTLENSTDCNFPFAQPHAVVERRVGRGLHRRIVVGGLSRASPGELQGKRTHGDDDVSATATADDELAALTQSAHQ